MSDEWKQILRDSVLTLGQLREKFEGVEFPSSLEQVTDEFPMRINPYYAHLIKNEGDPIWLQSVPDERELSDRLGQEDPLNEEGDSPVPHLTHRYPDRVLLLVTSQCAMFCRFCTRKRKVARDHTITPGTVQAGIDYIASHPEVRDVVVSGGDPLMLSDEQIDSVLERIRAIPHVQIIRVHTRVPAVLPQRVTPELCAILRKHHPLFLNTHFNSPIECTEEAKKACWMLADAGIPLGNQAVLIRGVNDDPAVMRELCHKLLMLRIRPYYLYQADMVRGIEHLRTPVQVGVDLVRSLRGHTSGLAIPQFVVDAPGGGGKIPLSPNYIVEREGDGLVLQNYEGQRFIYQDEAPRAQTTKVDAGPDERPPVPLTVVGPQTPPPNVVEMVQPVVRRRAMRRARR